MKNPEIVIYKQDENKYYLHELESGLCLGSFKTSNEAKRNMDAFKEIILRERRINHYTKLI